MELLRYSIILAAASLLLVSLLPVRRLLKELPAGPMRRGWHWLGALVVSMIVAELIYAFDWHRGLPVSTELMMPLALLAGSWFVVLISQLSAGSIDDLHRLSRLEEETITDGLTGLANRRHFDRSLAEAGINARKSAQALSLMLIDIDHFKQVNDRFGHLAGDDVLGRLGRTLRDKARASDLVARYGGEEFAILLPDTNIETAECLAERLRQFIASHPVSVSVEGKQSKTLLRPTVSIGVAQMDVKADQPETELISQADQALYKAKGSGRNRVFASTCHNPHPRVTYLSRYLARSA